MTQAVHSSTCLICWSSWRSSRAESELGVNASMDWQLECPSNCKLIPVAFSCLSGVSLSTRHKFAKIWSADKAGLLLCVAYNTGWLKVKRSPDKIERGKRLGRTWINWSLLRCVRLTVNLDSGWSSCISNLYHVLVRQSASGMFTKCMLQHTTVQGLFALLAQLPLCVLSLSGSLCRGESRKKYRWSLF